MYRRMADSYYWSALVVLRSLVLSIADIYCTGECLTVATGQWSALVVLRILGAPFNR